MRLYILLFVIVIFTSCKKSKSIINVELSPCYSNNVIGWYDSNIGKVWAISIPFVMVIGNGSSQKEELTFHQYIYKKPSEGAFAFLYDEQKNNELIKLSTTRKKNILPKRKKNLSCIRSI